MKRAVAIALVILGVLLLETSSRGDAVDGDISVAEMAAYLQAWPAFERNCYRCHTGSGEESNRKAVEPLNMSRYPFTGRRGPIAGRAIRKVLDSVSGRRTMPKDDPDSLNADDLTLILKWADTFDAARIKKNKGAVP